MKCPECQFDNPHGAKFCVECGAKLEKLCPQCNSSNAPEFKFCGECGYDFTTSSPTPPPPTPPPSIELSFEEKTKVETLETEPQGERKHVTVLFSDLCGYTAMSERLDPEEVKGIMDRIFGEIAQVVNKYDGCIDKFIGDAVMALFGTPKSHEDDPVRAIRAAQEIHDLVEAISPQLEERVGQPLSMHSGISTGLVVTGKVDQEKGAHGVSGDTINLASRLTSLASALKILGLPRSRERQNPSRFTGCNRQRRVQLQFTVLPVSELTLSAEMWSYPNWRRVYKGSGQVRVRFFEKPPC